MARGAEGQRHSDGAGCLLTVLPAVPRASVRCAAQCGSHVATILCLSCCSQNQPNNCGSPTGKNLSAMPSAPVSRVALSMPCGDYALSCDEPVPRFSGLPPPVVSLVVLPFSAPPAPGRSENMQQPVTGRSACDWRMTCCSVSFGNVAANVVTMNSRTSPFASPVTALVGCVLREPGGGEGAFLLRELAASGCGTVPSNESSCSQAKSGMLSIGACIAWPNISFLAGTAIENCVRAHCFAAVASECCLRLQWS